MDSNKNGTVTVDKVVALMAELEYKRGAAANFSEAGWEGASMLAQARDMLREVGSDQGGDWRLTRAQFHAGTVIFGCWGGCVTHSYPSYPSPP